MTRNAPFALLAATLLAPAVWPACAQAQEQNVNIYFPPLPGGDVAPLNKAIQTALSQPPMQLVAKPFAGVLVVSVRGKVEVEHKRVSGVFYTFSVSFSRDGTALGESQQACGADNLAECTDQLLQDVKSVMGR